MHGILVYADGFREWSGGVEYAAQLAAAEQAALTALYAYLAPAYAVPECTTPSLLAAMVENTRQIERESLSVKDDFVDWTKGYGVRKASWHVAEGFPHEILTRLGNWHDLLVLDRNEQMPWKTAAEVGALILRAALPCIVVPPTGAHDPRKLDCIAVGWNGTPEALRAVHAARSLLQRAGRVVVLNGRQRRQSALVEWYPPFDLTSYLKRHGIGAEVHDLAAEDADAGPALLDSAAALRADMLVMGAYGRPRFSEWIFGGATRHVLCHARIPALLCH